MKDDDDTLPTANTATRRFEDTLGFKGMSGDSSEFRISAGLARRYELRGILGAGGLGKVYKAWDHVGGELVALKVLRGSGRVHLAKLRAEVAALRLLRFPGVARLIDDGLTDGEPYLVMELVDGSHFPGVVGHATWTQLVEPTLRLLQTLRIVHETGVIHRDLKPENIMVCADGRVSILDFGIAHARPDPTQSLDSIAGTPAYLAPEQAAGQPCDARTDIYALGVMLFHALTGRFPISEKTLSELISAKVHKEPVDLWCLDPEVPGDVGDLINRMVARIPDDRPADVSEVLAILNGYSNGRELTRQTIRRCLGESPKDVHTAAELGRLFDGPQRILRIPGDAAEQLHLRTQGRLDLIEEQIDAWRLGGYLHPDGGKFCISRDSISRLDAQTRIFRSIVSNRSLGDTFGMQSTAIDFDPLLRVLISGDPEQAAETLFQLAESTRDSHRFLARTSLIQAMTALAHCDLPASDLQTQILTELAIICLGEQSIEGADTLLFELDRAPVRDPFVEQLETLANCARLALARDQAKCLALHATLRPFASPRLDHWRLASATSALFSTPDRLDVFLETAGAAARREGQSDKVAAVDNWKGLVAYRRGNFRAAADLHLNAAALTSRLDARLSALTNAAAALLELPDLDEAHVVLGQCKRISAELRAPQSEARLTNLERAVRYRMGRADSIDHEFLSALEHMDVGAFATLALLNEAAVAWRLGEVEACQNLCGRLISATKSPAYRQLNLLGIALGALSGLHISDSELRRCFDDTFDSPVPLCSAQTRALIAMARPKLLTWTELARGSEFLENVPARSTWREVLSPDECLSILRRSSWAGEFSPE